MNVCNNSIRQLLSHKGVDNLSSSWKIRTADPPSMVRTTEARLPPAGITHSNECTVPVCSVLSSVCFAGYRYGRVGCHQPKREGREEWCHLSRLPYWWRKVRGSTAVVIPRPYCCDGPKPILSRVGREHSVTRSKCKTILGIYHLTIRLI